MLRREQSLAAPMIKGGFPVEVAFGWGREGWALNPALAHWPGSPGCAEQSRRRGSRSATGPVSRTGQGKPHSEDLGYAGQRENGQESGGLPLLLWEALGKELCFGGQGARNRRGRGGDNHARWGPDAARRCGPFGAP